MSESIMVQLPVELDDEFFDNIICTMLEGGSNYWISTIKINHPNGMKLKSTPTSEWASGALNKGGSVTIFPHDAEGATYTLNKSKLISGLKLWIEKHPDHVFLMRENKKNTLDAGMDADDADAILQYAVFGDIIFG